MAVKRFTHAINCFCKQTYLGKYGRNKSQIFINHDRGFQHSTHSTSLHFGLQQACVATFVYL